MICLYEYLTNWLGKRPVIGTIISVTGLTTGTVMANTLDIILKLMQIMAFSGSILVSALTAIGWFRKNRKQKNGYSKVDKKD